MSNKIAILKDTTEKIYSNPNFEQIVADLKNLADKSEQTGSPLILEFKEWVTENTLVNLGFCRHFSLSLPSYHSHDYYELNFCTKGFCTEYVDGQIIVLKEGEVLLMSPGISHTLYCDSESIIYNLMIKKHFLESFDDKLSSKNKRSFLTQFLTKSSFAVFEPTKKANVTSILDEVLRYTSDKNTATTYKRIYLEAETNLILLGLSEYRIKASNFPAIPNTEKELIAEKILEYIYINCAKVSLEKISSAFGYSTTHIYRIIKKYTGKSYAEFLALTRMKKARKILETTDVSVSKIHSLIGLSSYDYFYKTFKKHSHMTPSEYRKMYKV